MQNDTGQEKWWKMEKDVCEQLQHKDNILLSGA